MTMLHSLSYVGGVVAFGFIVLSLASGLLWISELIEENSRIAKSVGQRGIYAIIALHVLLYFSDSLPLTHVLFSILCHVVYLQNFSNAWPLISLTSPSFILSCILVVADHFLWFFHFSKLTQDARHRAHRPYGRTNIPQAPGFGDIATFFTLCIWLAPLFLFLSLSANDNALPTLTGVPATPTTPSLHVQTKPRSSLFKSILRLGRKNTNEGLIAPRTPVPGSPLPTPQNGISALNNLPSRPTSPLLGGTPPNRAPSPALPSSFTLNAPPRRSTSSLVDGLHPPGADRLGMSLRRANTSGPTGIMNDW